MDQQNRVVTFSDLNFKYRLRLFWAFTWRSLATWLAAFVTALVVGFFLGLTAGIIGGILHVERADMLGYTRMSARAIGVGIGLVFQWLYITWLFRSTMAGFRLGLIRAPAAGVVPETIPADVSGEDRAGRV